MVPRVETATRWPEPGAVERLVETAESPPAPRRDPPASSAHVASKSRRTGSHHWSRRSCRRQRPTGCPVSAPGISCRRTGASTNAARSTGSSVRPGSSAAARSMTSGSSTSATSCTSRTSIGAGELPCAGLDRRVRALRCRHARRERVGSAAVCRAPNSDLALQHVLLLPRGARAGRGRSVSRQRDRRPVACGSSLACAATTPPPVAGPLTCAAACRPSTRRRHATVDALDTPREHPSPS